jgi:hypothetical protein
MRLIRAFMISFTSIDQEESEIPLATESQPYRCRELP